jgi:hypothetical protein
VNRPTVAATATRPPEESLDDYELAVLGRTVDVADFNWRAGVVAIGLSQSSGLGLVLGIAARGSGRKAVFVLAALVCLATVVSFLVDEPIVAHSALLVAVCLGALLWDTRSANKHPSHVSHVLYGSAITFSVFIAWMTISPELFSDLWQEIRAPEVIILVQRITILGMAAFSFGLVAGDRLLQVPFNALRDAIVLIEPRNAQETRRMTMVVFVAGMSLFATLIASKGFGYLAATRLDASVESLLGTVMFVYYLALYLANAQAFSHKQGLKQVLFIDALALTYELVSGSKGRFAVYVLFPIFLLSIFFRRRVTWGRTFGLGAVGLVAALAIYPLLVEYRSEYAKTTDVEHTGDRFRAASSRWSDDYTAKILRPVLESNTPEHVTALTSIVYYDVRIEQPVVMRLLTFWIPRAIWREKPMAVDPNLVGRASHRLGAADRNTAVLTTSMGELYLTYGSWGALFLALTGFVCRVLDVCFSPFERSSPWRAAVGAYLLVTLPTLLMGGFDGPLTGMMNSIGVVFAILIITQLVGRRALGLPASLPTPGKA